MMTLALNVAAAAIVSLSTTPADTVLLFNNLGDHHYEISTTNTLAQQYFDQGLRLMWGFNHAEAIRAFDQAAGIDPKCAICYWGIAFSYGPNINAPMDSTSGVAAWTTIQEAIALRTNASEREAAFIAALATRYAAVPPIQRAALDSAYARAMNAVADRYPEDHEAATLAADAIMNLSPWNYWSPDGQKRPETARLLTLLETVVAEDPSHPGACHLYIHAVEATEPQKAVACAERLAWLMPGAGHLVHMPAHIYIRVGRYNDAIESNIHAVHQDETYITDVGPAGIYPAFYYPHNYHFLAFASMFAGRGDLAVETARKAAEHMDLGVARMFGPEAARMLAQPHLTLMAFGRWEDVLAEPAPPADIRFAAGLVHYTRGVADAALQRWDDAGAELDSVRQIATEFTEDWPSTVMQIATHALMADIAYRRGEFGEAVQHYQVATGLQDGLRYTEPAYWNKPVRHDLGAALLAAGQPADAERVYREDLQKFPDNGWSLSGLALSLDAQGKAAEATEVRAQMEKAWSDANVTLAGSRF
jgi:tetratricopeptide (TPR) repeat protein